MNRRLIFVDVDGVLADFIGGVRGVFPPEMFDEQATGEYEVWRWLGMTKERFWSVIDRLGPAFWADLKRKVKKLRDVETPCIATAKAVASLLSL